MFKILLLILYLATILAVLFVERKNPTEALLWVLVVICLPYVGLILYFIFGSTTAIRMTAWLRRSRISKRLPPAREPQNLLAGQQFSDTDLQVMSFNAAYNDSPVTCYDDYRLLTSGEAHYRALFADIRQAKECIYVLFLTIHHDVMGESLARVLAEKAREGVKVLVMYDYLANFATPKKMFRELEEPR